jgi:hypothetical protein
LRPQLAACQEQSLEMSKLLHFYGIVGGEKVKKKPTNKLYIGHSCEQDQSTRAENYNLKICQTKLFCEMSWEAARLIVKCRTQSLQRELKTFLRKAQKCTKV